MKIYTIGVYGSTEQEFFNPVIRALLGVNTFMKLDIKEKY